MNSNDSRKPAPRIVGWIGVAVSIATIIMCLLVLTGCGDPCAQHGGTVGVIPHVSGVYDYHCADGTWTAA